jgi:hypothetical protein
MNNLTEEQKQTLVEIIIEASGPVLTRESFADAMLELFEFIPGFESIPFALEHCIVNQLWRKYHEQKAH